MKSHLLAALAPPSTEEAPDPAQVKAIAQRPLFDWQKEQKKREKREREERDRIRARIKDDHLERCRRSEMRKPHGSGSPSPNPEPSNADTNLDNGTPGASKSSTPSAGAIRVQTRLFDGSSFHTTFPRDASIASHVRPWIDSLTDPAEQTPYHVKIILTPQPNRTIQPAEEALPLADLDLASTWNLVIIPVHTFATARNTPQANILVGTIDTIASALSPVFTLLYTLLAALFTLLWTILTYPTTLLQTHQPHSRNPTAAAAAAASRQKYSAGAGQGIRIRTLADQRRDEHEAEDEGEAKGDGTGQAHQLYNGNATNFMPRKREDEHGEGEG